MTTCKPNIQIFLLDLAEVLSFSSQEIQEHVNFAKLIASKRNSQIPKDAGILLLRENGKSIDPDITIHRFLEELEIHEECVNIFLYGIGEDCSSANDLNFVGNIWKVCELKQDRLMNEELSKIKETHMYLTSTYPQMENSSGRLRDIEQLYATITSQITLIQKREKLLEHYENSQKLISLNHNNAIGQTIGVLTDMTGKLKNEINELIVDLGNSPKLLEDLSNQKVSIDGTKTLINYFDKDSLEKWLGESQIDVTRILKKVEEIDFGLDELQKSTFFQENRRRKLSTEFISIVEEVKMIDNYHLISEYPQNWKELLDANQNDHTSMDSIIDERQSLILSTLKEISLTIEESQSLLKKIFYKSIMSTRELIRKTALLQLKVEKKAHSKSSILEKLKEKLSDVYGIVKVLKNFKNTYSESQKEVERRVRFDWIIISMLNTMRKLVEQENLLRNSFLDNYAEFLPDSYCSFLTHRLNNEIIDPIEKYFKNDTELKDLNEFALEDIMRINANESIDEAPISLRDNIEGYLECLDGYNEIHKNLLSILSNKGNSSPTKFICSPKKPNCYVLENDFGLKLGLSSGDKITLRFMNVDDGFGIIKRGRKGASSFTIVGESPGDSELTYFTRLYDFVSEGNTKVLIFNGLREFETDIEEFYIEEEVPGFDI